VPLISYDLAVSPPVALLLLLLLLLLLQSVHLVTASS
jgi:hypothetical protein